MRKQRIHSGLCCHLHGSSKPPVFNHFTQFIFTCVQCEENARTASTLRSPSEVSSRGPPTHNAAHHYFLLLCVPLHLASAWAVWANCLPLFLCLNICKKQKNNKTKNSWIVHKDKSTHEVNGYMGREAVKWFGQAVNPGQSRWFPHLSLNLMDDLHKLSLSAFQLWWRVC